MKYFTSTLIALLWLVTPNMRGGVVLTKLVSFNGSNGAEPWGNLVQGPDGYFYGTTSHGGARGSGTVFKMSGTGTITVLHSFAGVDGAGPFAGLAWGKDGDLYGTTVGGGSASYGTIFRIMTNGVFTSLFSFSRVNGASPWNGELVQGSDGYFYGTTAQGGNLSPALGTVFKISPNGVFQSLLEFDYGNGGGPLGGLTEGADGNLYGMTSLGQQSSGRIFKITPVGVLTTLASFKNVDGHTPFSTVTQAADGRFYGTTMQGGESFFVSDSVNRDGFGTVFRFTSMGQLKTLFSFWGTNGAYPYASLVMGRDGRYYGTTLSGGIYTNGTIFRITTNGEFTSLVSFDNTNGAAPMGHLLLGKDGKFYGMTKRGGDYGLGAVYQLSVSGPPKIECASPSVVECGSVAEISARVSDPDGGALKIYWEANGTSVQTNTITASAAAETVVSLSVQLPLGTNVITASVVDDEGSMTSCSTTITMVDAVAPVVGSVEASPVILWPPNHQMVDVNVSAEVVDGCTAATWKIVSVQSNEPMQAKQADWVITGDHTVSLRAERSGKDGARIYSIFIEGTDAAGNRSVPKVVAVTVPQSQGKGK